MRRTVSIPLALAAAIAGLAALACDDVAAPAANQVTATPDLHVGYKGPDVPLGFVSNDAECHIGKRGDRWPQAEWYDVKTYDAHLVVTPSGVVTLVCNGRIPADQPLPDHAEVEQGVLCFLPGQRDTRDAQEVFTPSGNIELTCHLNPNE
jgi:hypothetical protein